MSWRRDLRAVTSFSHQWLPCSQWPKILEVLNVAPQPLVVRCDISPLNLYVLSLAPRKAISPDASLPPRTEQGLHWFTSLPCHKHGTGMILVSGTWILYQRLDICLTGCWPLNLRASAQPYWQRLNWILVGFNTFLATKNPSRKTKAILTPRKKALYSALR